jgi:hypothetical protein
VSTTFATSVPPNAVPTVADCPAPDTAETVAAVPAVFVSEKLALPSTPLALAEIV